MAMRKNFDKEKERKERAVDELIQAALALREKPDNGLNQKIIQSWKESPNMRRMAKGKIVVVMAVLCLFVMTITVAAAAKYLTAKEVADKAGATKIADAFQGDSALELNEIKEAGDYRVTLLGIASGEALTQSEVSEKIPELEGLYAAIAIERIDGQPMPDTRSEEYSNMQWFISPLIQGLAPWQYNIASMNGGYYDTVENGIFYRLINCDDIAKFADRKLYLCVVSDTVFYNVEAFQYNEVTGEICENKDYNGVNLLFGLPIDRSKADTKAAEQYLKELEASWSSGNNDSEEPSSLDLKMQEISDLLAGGKEEEALEGAELMEDSVKTVKKEEGVYQYEFSSENETTVIQFYETNFVDGKDFTVFSGNDSGQEVIYIITLVDNKNDTVTIQTYKKIIGAISLEP